MAVIRKWGWWDSHKKEAWNDLFDSPDKAIAEMTRRQGEDLGLPRLADIGFQLALFDVQIKPVMLMGSA